MAVPSNPGWKYGYTPTPGEWNNTFAGKADYPVPVDQGGTGAQNAAAANYALQQRAQIITPTANVTPLGVYSVRTDLTASTLTLPLAASCKAGDWIEVLDAGANAAVNNITVAGSGSDEIYLFATSAATQQIATNGGSALFVCIGTAWRMWSLSALAPAATSLDGTEIWNAYKNGVPEAVTAAQVAAFVGALSRYLYWSVWFAQSPTSDELLGLWTVPVNVLFPSNFAAATTSAPFTGPSATWIATVSSVIAGTTTTIGTLTVHTDGSVVLATTGGSPVAITAGTQLSLVGPHVADATIAGLSLTFRALIS